MTISDLVQQMADAGAPISAIIMAIRAIEERDAADADRRAKVSERKRRQRERERDRRVTVTSVSRDERYAAPPLEEKRDPSPCTPSREKTQLSPDLAPLGDTTGASSLEIVEQGTEPKRTPARSPTAPAEHEAFPEFWAAYPKRYGTNSRAGAAEKFRALVRSGIDPPALIAGAERYRRQCEARGVVGSEFVQQATTWLNPKNRAWEEAYDLPDHQKQPIRRDRDDTLRDGAGRAVDPIVAAVMHRRSLRGDRGRPADPDPGFDLDGEGGAPPADRVDRGRGFASVVRGCDRGGGRPPVDDAAQGWR